MNLEFVTRLIRTECLDDIRSVLIAKSANLPALAEIFDWAFNASEKLPAFSPEDPLDAIYWQAIQSHRAHQRTPTPPPSRRSVGLEGDLLASPDVMDRWTPLKCLCHLVAYRTAPNRTVAAVVGMRDEGATALEWIAHHLTIGIDRIFVYSNDNSDQTDIILNRLAEHDLITFIDNRMSGGVSPQHKIYEHFLRIVPEARDYKWCLFTDSDEFLVPDEKYNFDVKQLLLDATAAHGERLGAIWFPWRWVLSGCALSRGPDLLARRFRYSRKHRLVKSVAKVRDIVDVRPLHSPFLVTDRFPVTAAFERVSMQDLFAREEWPETAGKLYHYWCKSFEEFYAKKRRGDTLTFDGNAYRRELDLFFEWNGAEDPRYYDPIPEPLTKRVQEKLAELNRIPEVSEAVRQADALFRRNVERDARGRPLAHLYAETMTRLTEAEPVSQSHS